MEEKNLKFVETGRGKIYYWLATAPEARTTAVFLHGLSANHTTWTAVLEKFQNLGLNCLVLDMRGHGLSDMAKTRANYRLPVFADDLNAIIKKEGLREIVLIGYSGGGMIGLQYALSYPESLAALVLISANYVSPLNYRGLRFLNPLVYVFLNALAWLLIWQKRKKYYYFEQAEVGAAGYWEATFRGLRTMPLAINFWMLSEGLRANFTEALGKITCPCLILRANKDPFLSLEEAANMNQSIKNSQLAVLNALSHFLGSDYQQLTADTIINYLKEKSIM